MMTVAFKVLLYYYVKGQSVETPSHPLSVWWYHMGLYGTGPIFYRQK